MRSGAQLVHAVLERALAERRVRLVGEALELSPSTEGLLGAHPDRVHLLPASDSTLVGLAVGMALHGDRVVVELSGPGALWGALQQLGQEAGPLGDRSEFSAPVVLRVPVAPGEAVPLEVLTALQGVRIVAPSGPGEAAGLLEAALRASGPVVMLEALSLLGERAAAPQALDLGRARVLREGGDATALAWGQGVGAALRAADELDAEGLSLEVIDLVSLSPIDAETIGRAVAATGRPLLVDGGRSLLSVAVDQAFLRLESPPFHAAPDAQAVADAARASFHY